MADMRDNPIVERAQSAASSNRQNITPSDVTSGSGGGGEGGRLNDPGILGVDLLGGATGVAGTVASAVTGGVFNAINTPWHMVESNVASIRLNHAIRAGDQQVDQKYIKMVTEQGKSVSEVADLMATDGVGITGGVPHDLLLSLFLDPFNLVAMGAGKAWDVGKRASDIEQRYTDSAHKRVTDDVVRDKSVTAEELAWLHKPGRKVLATAYNKISRPLRGAKRGLAQALFGTAAGRVLTYIGVSHIKDIMEVATNAGRAESATEALASGLNHVTKMAGADVLTARALERNLADAEAKARIIENALGKDDVNAFNQFYDATSAAARTGDLTVAEARSVFESLIDTRDAAIKAAQPSQQIVTQRILSSSVAGDLQESIGTRGLTSSLSDVAATDGERVARTAAAQREVAVADNMVIVGQGEDVVRAAYIENLTQAMGPEAAAAAWERTIARAPKADAILGGVRNLAGRRIKFLAEALYASEHFRLGSVAEAFGPAKQRLVDTLADPVAAKILMENLPPKTRAMIADQFSRASLVAKDTMTDKDLRELLKVLGDESLDTAAKAKVAQQAVLSYSNLRRAFDARTFNAALDANPEAQITMLLEHLSRGGFAEQLPNAIPITNFKGIQGVESIQTMIAAAESGGYKLILETPSLTTGAMINYAENAGKVSARAGVDVWVPITNGAVDVNLGSRNLFGRYVDIMGSGITNSMIVANSMTRMQEYAIRNELGLSRNELISLHDELMSESFRSGGSVRTAFLDANTNPSVRIMDNLVAKARLTDRTAAQKWAALRANGKLRQMIFFATEGDLAKVGIPTKITGWLKTKDKMGDVLTAWADKYYPALKYRKSHVFSGQEVFESKWWNVFRGYQTEWKLTSKLPEPLRVGEKRYYDVLDPITKEPIRVDSIQVINDSILADRAELRAAQDLAAINQFYGGSISDSVIRFGSANEGFVNSMKAFLKLQPGAVKGLDYLAYVRTEGLDKITPVIAAGLKEHAPAQWELFMSAAGQSEKGAALLFLRERQILTSNRSTVRMYLEHNKPIGIGFGRQYADDPIKNLNIHLRELRVATGKGYVAQKLAMEESETVLSVIRAEALAIGYRDETLKVVDEAMKANREAQKLLRVNSENVISKKGMKAHEAAVAKAQEASKALRAEFEAATLRKGFVKKSLATSGVPKSIADELTDLFIVAERRGEMIPEVVLAVTKSLKSGEPLATETTDALLNHLMKIREVRTEEETLWNAIAHGIDGAMYNADKTHFFKTDRNLIERSINHPVLAFYPASYMFNKVLPEYARFLYLSPKNSAARLFLKPYQYIVHAATGGKFTPQMWGEFAPLVGWNAMMKVRMALGDQFGTDRPANLNPIANLFTNTIVPGFPWDITVSLSSPVITAIDAIGSGKLDPFDVIRSGKEQLLRAVGPAKVLDTAVNVGSQVAQTPLEEIQQGSMDFLDSIHDFLLNK